MSGKGVLILSAEGVLIVSGKVIPDVVWQCKGALILSGDGGKLKFLILYGRGRPLYCLVGLGGFLYRLAVCGGGGGVQCARGALGLGSRKVEVATDGFIFLSRSCSVSHSLFIPLLLFLSLSLYILLSDLSIPSILYS